MLTPPPKTRAAPVGHKPAHRRFRRYDAIRLNSFIDHVTGCANKWSNQVGKAIPRNRLRVPHFLDGSSAFWLAPDACRLLMHSMSVALHVSYLAHQRGPILERIARLNALPNVSVDRSFETVILKNWIHHYWCKTEPMFWGSLNRLLDVIALHHYKPTGRLARIYFRDSSLRVPERRHSDWYSSSESELSDFDYFEYVKSLYGG